MAGSPSPPVPRLVPSTDVNEAHIYTLMTSLGNAVITSTAWHALAKLYAEHPEWFRSASLLCRAVHLMNHFTLRLAVRRHIWNVLEQIPLSLSSIAEMEHIKAEILIPVAIHPASPRPVMGRQLRSNLLYTVPALPHACEPASQAGHVPRSTEVLSRPASVPGSVARSAWPLRVTGFAAPNS